MQGSGFWVWGVGVQGVGAYVGSKLFVNQVVSVRVWGSGHRISPPKWECPKAHTIWISHLEA